MPCACGAGVELGYFILHTAGFNGIAAGSEVLPILHGFIFQRRRCERIDQNPGGDVVFAYQLRQGAVFGLHGKFRCAFLRQSQVVGRLRFAAIGDGGGADFKVALGKSQLLRHGLFLATREL